jgi:hypothetical protein
LALALASDYQNSLKNYYCRCASFLVCLDESNFSNSRKQDCSAMLNQIVQQRMNNLPKKCQFNDLLQIPQRELVIGWSMKSDKLLLKVTGDFSNTDLREKIKNIKCPTLVLLRIF